MRPVDFAAKALALGVVPAALAALGGCDKSSDAAPGATVAQNADAGAATENAAAIASSKAKFETTVRPILLQHCASCHGDKIKPFHSSPNVDVAYDEIMAFHLVDFATPKNSRLYTRLAVDNHQCWGGDCAASSQTMLDAITAWASSGPPAPQGPLRKDGPNTSIVSEITQGSVADRKLNESATELSFTMATPSQGPVVFSIRVEKFDKYSYRLFLPAVRAPEGVSITAKGLLFKLNDALRPDGSFTLLDTTVAGKGADKPVVLDGATTMILLMDKGPGADQIAPSFVAFDVK